MKKLHTLFALGGLAAVTFGLAVSSLPTLAARSSPSLSPSTSIASGTGHVGQWFLFGANMPWLNWNSDFGGGSSGVAHNLAAVDAKLQGAQGAGMHIVRWWVFEGGSPQITRDGSGVPTGLNPAIYPDLDAALTEAAKYGISYDFVLFGGTNDDAVTHQWWENSAKRSALATVLAPLFARYASNRLVHTWEIVNEPDWQTRNGITTVAGATSTVDAIADAVHANSSALVTVGQAQVQDMATWVGHHIDYHSPHYYDGFGTGSNDPFVTPVASPDGKPVVIGEFQAYSGLTPTAQQRWQAMYQNGYAGGWSWSLSPEHTGDGFATDLVAAAAFAQGKTDLGPQAGGLSVSVAAPAFTEGLASSGMVAAFANATCPCTATIDWGDGTSVPGTVSGTSVSGSHTYAEEGADTIKVTVTDSGAKSASGSQGINVADAGLNGSGTSASVMQGTPFSGQVATFSDADPAGVPSDYSATINWGDGTSSAGTVAAGSVSGSHTYSSSGTMHPKITIKDSGGASVAPTGTITVTPTPPPPGPCTGAGAGASPGSPQPPGTPVKLTATSSGCLTPQYEFWLMYPNGTWVMKQPFSTSATWNWDTTGYPGGAYTIHVWANQVGDPTTTWEAYGTLNYSLSVASTCTTASLSPVNPSQAAGSTVNLTASSGGCPNPQYEFWVQYRDGSWNLKQGWGGATFSWDTTGLPPGSYVVHVWANQIGDSTATWEAYGSDTVTLSGSVSSCTSAALAPVNPSAAAGTTVNLTASSSGCSNPQYEFWVQYRDGSWNMRQGWGGATFNWTTTGLTLGGYVVHVWANQTGDSTATWEAFGSDTVTLTGCTSASLAPINPTAAMGTTVQLTASSTGCTNPQYEFWVGYPNGSWVMKQGWGGNTFSWNTAGVARGSYVVHVWVISQGDSTATWEAYGSDTVTLTGCTSASLAPPSGSAVVGSKITFTASSNGCPTPIYEFWLQYPDGSWHIVQSFNTNTTWQWDTTGLGAGSYVIHVWANSQGADTSMWESYGTATYTLT